MSPSHFLGIILVRQGREEFHFGAEDGGWVLLDLQPVHLRGRKRPSVPIEGCLPVPKPDFGHPGDVRTPEKRRLGNGGGKIRQSATRRNRTGISAGSAARRNSQAKKNVYTTT